MGRRLPPRISGAAREGAALGYNLCNLGRGPAPLGRSLPRARCLPRTLRTPRAGPLEEDEEEDISEVRARRIDAITAVAQHASDEEGTHTGFSYKVYQRKRCNRQGERRRRNCLAKIAEEEVAVGVKNARTRVEDMPRAAGAEENMQRPAGPRTEWVVA